jgi:hypothetical protein
VISAGSERGDARNGILSLHAASLQAETAFPPRDAAKYVEALAWW